MPFLILVIVLALVALCLLFSVFKNKKQLNAAKKALAESPATNEDGSVFNTEEQVKSIKSLKRKFCIKVLVLLVLIVVIYIVI